MAKPQIHLSRLNEYKQKRTVGSTDITYARLEDFLIRNHVEIQVYWLTNVFEAKAGFRTKARRMHYAKINGLEVDDTYITVREKSAFEAYKKALVISFKKFILAV